MEKRFLALSLLAVLGCSPAQGMQPPLFETDDSFCLMQFFRYLDVNAQLALRGVNKRYKDLITKFSMLHHNGEYLGEMFFAHRATQILQEKDGVEKTILFFKSFGPSVGIKLPKTISDKNFKKLLSSKVVQQKLLYLDATECTNIKDFSPLKACTNLFCLDLSLTNVVASDLKNLAFHLPNLEMLMLNYLYARTGNSSLSVTETTAYNNNVSRFFESKQLEHLKKLKSLQLDSTIISDKALETISKNLPNLEILDLTTNDELTNHSCIAKLENLQRLYIDAKRSSSKEIEPLFYALQKIDTLHISNCDTLKKFPYQTIIALENLKELQLLDADLTNDHLKAIGNLYEYRNLQKLILWNSCKNTSDFSPIAQLTTLRSLTLTQTEIDAKTFALIASKLKKLTTLKVDDNDKIGDLSSIANLHHLESLTCDSNAMTNKSLELIAINCTKLIEFSMYANPSLTCFIPLKNLSNLKRFYLHTAEISDEDLAEITPYWSNLEELTLTGCQNITDFEPLAQLTSLTRLKLDTMNVQNEAYIRLVKQLPNLKRLEIAIRVTNIIQELSKLIPNLFNHDRRIHTNE